MHACSNHAKLTCMHAGGTLYKGLNRATATLSAGSLAFGIHWLAIKSGKTADHIILGTSIFILCKKPCITFSSFSLIYIIYSLINLRMVMDCSLCGDVLQVHSNPQSSIRLRTHDLHLDVQLGGGVRLSRRPAAGLGPVAVLHHHARFLHLPRRVHCRPPGLGRGGAPLPHNSQHGKARRVPGRYIYIYIFAIVIISYRITI